MRPTVEQERAITLKNTDILVSAGAGAGKTRVLVSRIADLLTNADTPVYADEILVMTFTNAAAREMKDRIITELSGRMEKDPSNTLLRRQIRLLRHADISTIHSFCSRILKNNFQEIGLDPSFRIGEEGEMLLLRSQALADLLEEAYDQGFEDFKLLVEAFAAGKDDRNLEDMIRRLYDFSRGFPDAGKWFEDQQQMIAEWTDAGQLEASEAVRGLIKKTKEQIMDLQSETEQAFLSFTEQGEDPLPERYQSLLTGDRNALEEISDMDSYNDFYQFFRDFSLPDLPRGVRREEKACTVLEELKDLHRTIRTALHDLRDTVFALSAEELCEENRNMLPLVKELSRLTIRYNEIYGSLKKKQNVYDFDDLEHMALKLLVSRYDSNGDPVPSDTALLLSRKYKEIYVDEYQDTSLVQETIINVLHSPERNHLFMVGDVKQSIYRFRQARPDLFLSRQRQYADDAADGKKMPAYGVNISLQDNFRSAPEILNLCNKLFSGLMDQEFGGIDYNNKNALRTGQGGPMEKVRDKPEILLLMEDEEKDNLSWEYDALYAETVMIAEKAKALHNEGFCYSDMVILLRSGMDRAEQMAEYLQNLNVPARSENRTGYFHTREIGVILSYLSVIDNVYQDIPMASVLLSSIGGLSEEDMVHLKTQIEAPMRRTYSLFELLELYENSGEDPILKNKVTHFLQQLRHFRRQKKELPLHSLLWNIYQETGFYYDVLLMSDGNKRRENMNMLLQKAEDYEKTVFKGLFYFIRYMEQLRSYEVELPEAETVGNTEDSIRIMTIHKSKGLEFPVVFVSGLSRQFNFTDFNQPVITHPEFGLGLETVDLENRIHHPSLIKKILTDRARKEMLEEELRILYVAVTRAQQKLFLTGVISEKMMDRQKGSRLTFSDKMAARCFMDWVLPAALRDAILPYVKIVHLHQLDLPGSSENSEKKERSLKDILSAADFCSDISRLEKVFSYRYPFETSVFWKRKYSVSELKKLSMTAPSDEPVYQDGHNDIDELLKIRNTVDKSAAVRGSRERKIPVPHFMKKEKTIEPAERGTIVHKIMEILPFREIKGPDSLQGELEVINRNYKKTEQISMEDFYSGFTSFFFSEEGEMLRRMDMAGKLFKEVPFTISIPASYVEPGFSREENIVVQGVIDLYGECDEGLWLLDYKTDRIRPGQEQVLLDRYRKQMLYYKTALEMLVKKPVVRTYIYSFALCRFIRV